MDDMALLISSEGKLCPVARSHGNLGFG